MRPDRIRDRPERAVGRGYFPHQLSWLIDNPLRRLIVPPERFASRLPVNRTTKILEIGPGSGYFSVALARRVPDGHLALFDLQPEMLVKAKSKLSAGVGEHVSFAAGDLSAGLPFREGWFDLVTMVAVLGEVSEVSAGLESIHRVLVPRGFLAVHEHLPDPDRISFRTLERMAKTAHFRVTRRWGPGWNYTALLEKRANPAEAAV